MSTVAILSGMPDAAAGFMAISGVHHATGRTKGAALDALEEQLPEEQSASLVVMQSMKPDGFFGAAQQDRLRQLMDSWNQAPEETVPAELLQAVDEELKATIERSKALLIRRA